MKRAIQTAMAPTAIGPYSQAVTSGPILCTAGQIPLDPATGKLVEGGIAPQTDQALKNINAILEAAGLDLTDVIKTTVFLTTMSDFAGMNEVYGRHFTEPYPARSTVAVKELPLGSLVEIEILAARRG
jgi:2-iminobutanoate/2-iminopropanoate deaminase